MDGPDNVRNLRATHILKQTGSYVQANYAILDTPATVSKHYGRFLPQDKAALAAHEEDELQPARIVEPSVMCAGATGSKAGRNDPLCRFPLRMGLQHWRAMIILHPVPPSPSRTWCSRPHPHRTCAQRSACRRH
ncbi:MAG: hypothetical protein B7Y95_01600 [Rhizobiales bacterium 32-66-11]|nr:MAG: hypothetical protein B7Y95_01600 [Rhizobiales bacterium 32-66-11]